jgi:hypothetical protein
MSSLLELIEQQLGSGGIEAIGKQLGTDQQQTRAAVGAALPALVGALTRSGATEQGAAGILGALDRDHDGSILDDLQDFLGQKKYDDPRGGAGILSHLLGGRQPRLEKNLSLATGLSADNSQTLLKMLAPILLGALGKQKKSGGFDTGSLVDFLGKEKAAVEKQGGSFLGRMLDQDGDGDFDISDMAKLAMGKLFGRK